MGLFVFLSRRAFSRRRFQENSPARSHAAIERLEQCVLFDVQVSTPAFDGPPPSGNLNTGFYADQAETTNATFSMPGSSSNQVVVAYNDGAMKQYQQSNGSYMHQTGWAYSSDGGQSFKQPSTNPADAVLLPTVSDGTETTGDEANHSLAWDNK